MGDFFLADDLSGILDAAAGFHHAGRPVTIALSRTVWGDAPDDEVVGFTTESRNLTPDAARVAVTEAIEHGSRQGGRLLYKKIDSTLRGPVGAELSAVAAALPEATLLFAPANPGAGRTVRDGVLLVHGVPVAATEFGRDPLSPVRESRLHALIAEVAPSRMVIPDIATEEDFQIAVERLEQAGRTWIGIGSGALARVVGRVIRRPAAPASIPESLPAGPCVMIGGSAHPRNRDQANTLSQEHGLAIVELDPGDVEQTIRQGVLHVRERGGVILIVPEQRSDSARIVRAMAACAAAVIRTADAQRVFATGGETAFALCGELGIERLRFEAEIESGLSLSRGRGADGTERRLAIKPGGFGDGGTWIRAWAALRR